MQAVEFAQYRGDGGARLGRFGVGHQDFDPGAEDVRPPCWMGVRPQPASQKARARAISQRRKRAPGR